VNSAIFSETGAITHSPNIEVSGLTVRGMVEQSEIWTRMSVD
jgi:hypothetical protein